MACRVIIDPPVFWVALLVMTMVKPKAEDDVVKLTKLLNQLFVSERACHRSLCNLLQGLGINGYKWQELGPPHLSHP